METTYAQKSSDERLLLALNAAGIGVFDNDLLTDQIYFSGNGHELFGLTPGATLTLDALVQYIHPADRERTFTKRKNSLDAQQRAVYENEYRIIQPQTGETIRWVRAKGKAYFTEIGTPYRFTGTVQDITAEVEARETQQKLLALVDNSIELMSILENNQKNSYINKAGMAMLGFDNLQQVHDTPISELHTPEDIAFVQANVLPAVVEKGRWSGVMNVRHLKTGEVFPVLNNTVRIHDQLTGEPIAIGAVMRDLRAEMAAQKALEESERNFRTLVMQAPVGICILKGEDFVVELANDTFLELADKRRDEMVGKRVVDVFPEATRQGFDQMLHQVFTSGEAFYAREYEVHQERNGEVRTIYVDFTFQPLRDADGVVTRIMDVSVDVTDKVLARRRIEQSEEELQRRVAERTAELEKKNRELEEFTYVSSHDLQEPIRKIKIFREMIRERDYENMSDASKVRFDKVGETIDRMAQSLRDLLDYASLEKKEERETVDLNTTLQQVLQDLELVIEQKQAIIQKDALPQVTGVPHQLHQLFYNLVNNALKFTMDGVPPRITISVQKATPELPAGLPDPSKAYHLITVRDNGIGFSQEKAEKIFVMFQRLHRKEDYGGTGIGLALCKKVVSNHGGRIWATSEPGKGACFFILLPVS